jgi:hypothetical protein
MRKTVIALCAIVLLISGCVTVPPWSAIGRSATPRPIGPESGYTGFGQPGAHDWTDDDARTLLWLRSNFPELWADIPFPIIELFSYNQHNLIKPFSPFEWSYYFANADDPELLVRMLSVSARDRNETRKCEVLAQQEAERAAAEKPICLNVDELSDQQVADNLLVIYP